MRYLVTGAAGFIGYHVCQRLLNDGHEVVGIDNLNDFYPVSLKQARLDRLHPRPGFLFRKLDLEDAPELHRLFAQSRFERVIHLAAQAGVRHSLLHPEIFVHSNLVGHQNVLDGCRLSTVPHIVYASSSSVYGLNPAHPSSERDPADHPVSPYAATKRAAEILTHAYSHCYSLPATGLRLFTVYGPWGRPDMAYFKFAESIMSGTPIDMYGGQELMRDFTYIDDVVEAMVRVAAGVPASFDGEPAAMSDPSRSSAPFRIFNVGRGQPASLLDLVAELERTLGRAASRREVGPQAGEVKTTFADTSALEAEIGYRPGTPLAVGIRRFSEWFLEYRAR